jgi:hypothetical protein
MRPLFTYALLPLCAPQVYTNEDYFRERAAHKDSGASHLLTHNEDDNDVAAKVNDPHAASSIAVAALPFASATTGAPAVAMQTAQALPTALSQVPQAAVYGVGSVQQSAMYGGVQASGVQQSYQSASGQPMFSTNGAAYQQSHPQAMCQDPIQVQAMASADPQQPTCFAHMPQHMGQIQQQQMNAALAQMPGHMQMPVSGQLDGAQQMGQVMSALHAAQQMAHPMVAPAQTMPIAEATTAAVAPASYEAPPGGDATDGGAAASDYPEEGSNKKARTDEHGF